MTDIVHEAVDVAAACKVSGVFGLYNFSKTGFTCQLLVQAAPALL